MAVESERYGSKRNTRYSDFPAVEDEEEEEEKKSDEQKQNVLLVFDNEGAGKRKE